MSSLSVIIATIRPSFLILTPVCLFLGWSFVWAENRFVHDYLLVLTFTGAMMAHISVNMLNEYLDYTSGLDLNTTRTAFSGGSGALPNHPKMAASVLTIGITALFVTLLIGVFFVWLYGWQLLPIGVSGLLIIVAYTRWINRYPWLCLVAPGLGFGLLMTVGAYFAITGVFNQDLWLISLVPFFLVNNLLLLNQYPDIEADKMAGRNHFPIAYGVSSSNLVYFLFLVLTMLVIIISVVMDILPNLSLMALIATPIGFYALSGALKFKQNIGQHPQFLVANVIVTVAVPVLLGASIIIG